MMNEAVHVEFTMRDRLALAEQAKERAEQIWAGEERRPSRLSRLKSALSELGRRVRGRQMPRLKR